MAAIKQLENLMRFRCKLISLNPVSAASSSISPAPAAIIDTSGTGGASAANWPAQREGPVSPWATFLLVAIGTFMTMLDASIVNISLPSIARTFHTPLGGAIEWVIIAYLVTIAARC